MMHEDLTNFTTGANSKAMTEYLELLKAELMTKTADNINNITEIQKAIDAGWQGISKDRFMQDFKEQREVVISDLEKEYKNLLSRMVELQNEYFQTDMNLIDE